MKNSIRRTFAHAILVLALVVNTVPSSLMAQDNETPKPAAAIKYLGNNNDQLLFQVDFENKEEESFTLIIKDEEGNTLFNGRFRDKSFTKKFMFDRSEMGASRLEFTIGTGKGKQTQVFQVATRVVEDVVVTRM